MRIRPLRLGWKVAIWAQLGESEGLVGLAGAVGGAVVGAVGGPGGGGYFDDQTAAAPGTVAGWVKCPGCTAGVVGVLLAEGWRLAAVVAVPRAVVHRRPA